MNLPNCLKLEKRQIDLLDKWHKTITKPTQEEHDKCYGGFVLKNPVYFRIEQDSLGTSIKAINSFAPDEEIDLTIDDNNEMVNDYIHLFKKK